MNSLVKNEIEKHKKAIKDLKFKATLEAAQLSAEEYDDLINDYSIFCEELVIEDAELMPGLKCTLCMSVEILDSIQTSAFNFHVGDDATELEKFLVSKVDWDYWPMVYDMIRSSQLYATYSSAVRAIYARLDSKGMNPDKVDDVLIRSMKKANRRKREISMRDIERILDKYGND